MTRLAAIAAAGCEVLGGTLLYPAWTAGGAAPCTASICLGGGTSYFWSGLVIIGLGVVLAVSASRRGSQPPRDIQ